MGMCNEVVYKWLVDTCFITHSPNPSLFPTIPRDRRIFTQRYVLFVIFFPFSPQVSSHVTILVLVIQLKSFCYPEEVHLSFLIVRFILFVQILTLSFSNAPLLVVGSNLCRLFSSYKWCFYAVLSIFIHLTLVRNVPGFTYSSISNDKT